MKIGDSLVSDLSPDGFRARFELPGGLLITVEQRIAMGRAEDGKLVGHNGGWKVCCQLLVYLPTSRKDAAALIGHLLDHFDPWLRKYVEDATRWIDEIPEGEAVPTAPAGPGPLN